MSIKEWIEKRLQEIPIQLEQLVAERNQLLGYKQALDDSSKKPEDKPNGKIKPHLQMFPNLTVKQRAK